MESNPDRKNILGSKRKSGHKRGPTGPRPASKGSKSRRLALDALERIDTKGAYANLVVPKMLGRSNLSDSDRALVTSMVYGTTRMRRACDHLVDRFVKGKVEPEIRAALRLGAYQLVYLGVPPHAALDATVGAVRGRGRSVVNAVLRRVADAPVEFPSLAVQLSYPDWIVESLNSSLGTEAAEQALWAMNEPAEVTVRDDGYVQDKASQLVIERVGAGPDDVVIDVCAAPGGKTTAMSASGAFVVGADLNPTRAGLIRSNAERLGSDPAVVVADGMLPPIRPGSADKVLVDAPCSGLGSLRRRPDARWRIEASAPCRLAVLQHNLVLAGLELLKPGGTLVYSVCTLTTQEGRGVLESVRKNTPIPVSVVEPDHDESPWETTDGVSRIVPAQTDGMVLFELRRH